MAMTYATCKGVTVFATVRKQSDLESLLAEFKSTPTPLPVVGDDVVFTRGDLVVILMDVNSQDSIKKAQVEIEDKIMKENLVLISLINNAGFAQPSQCELIDDQRLYDQFNTNVFGLIHMTNQFLPLLRRSVRILSKLNSRLVPSVLNVGSVASFMSLSPLGIYAATKWSVKTLTETYRHELFQMGVNFTTICPGAVKTKFYDTCNHNKIHPQTVITTTMTEIDNTDDVVDSDEPIIVSLSSFSPEKIVNDENTPGVELGRTTSLSINNGKTSQFNTLRRRTTIVEEKIVEKKMDLKNSVMEPFVQNFYHRWNDAMQEHLGQAEATAQSPGTVSRCVWDVILSPRPNAFYSTGLDSLILIPLLRWIGPSGLFDALARRAQPKLEKNDDDKKKD
jgi:short-subunit dehydrogenase